MKKTVAKLLVYEEYLNLSPREFLVLSWLKMGKPKMLKKWMTKSNCILHRFKNKLYEKGLIDLSYFTPRAAVYKKSVQ